MLTAGLMVSLSCGIVFAANKDVGTTGAQFLKIGAGARPVGMGEAFTGVADDVNAIAWNPAGLAFLTRPEFTAMHSQWFQDTDYEFAAGVYPTAWGTFGIGASTLNIDKIEKRTADTETPDSTFESSDGAYLLSYSRTMGSAWAVGVNARYISEQLDTEKATSVSADLGAFWKTPHRPLTMGLSVRHLGSQIKFREESDPLPRTVTLGLGYKMFSDRLTLGVDFRRPVDDGVQYAVGAELTQKLLWDIAGSLRTGYNTAGTDADGLTGLSVGMGLSWRHYSFESAWVPYGDLGQTFRYALVVKF